MNEMNTIYLLASGVNRLVKLELLIRLPTYLPTLTSLEYYSTPTH